MMLGITFRSYLLFQFHENNSFQPDMSISSLRMTQKADVPILLMPVSHISRIFEKKKRCPRGSTICIQVPGPLFDTMLQPHPWVIDRRFIACLKSSRLIGYPDL